MLTLDNLKSPKGAHRNIKRIGRGHGSGRGTQAGKGHKGQKARSGGGVRTGFIGGAMPLYMRLPKRGFLNAPFKKEYAIVSLSRVDGSFEGSEEVTRKALIEKKILKGSDKTLPVKILAGAIPVKALHFVGIEKFSKSARRAVEESGGSIKK